MSELDRPEDFELPKPGSELNDWRWFVARNLGIDTAAYVYLDVLCNKFGVDYEITTDPDVFLDHVARVAFTAEHEAHLQRMEA